MGTKGINHSALAGRIKSRTVGQRDRAQTKVINSPRVPGLFLASLLSTLCEHF